MLAKIACDTGMHFPKRVGYAEKPYDLGFLHLSDSIIFPVYKCTACEKLFIKKETP